MAFLITGEHFDYMRLVLGQDKVRNPELGVSSVGGGGGGVPSAGAIAYSQKMR